VNMTWTEEAIRALGVRTDVETAGSIFGLSRTQSYEAIKAGRFPVECVFVGRRIIVPTAPIRRLLLLETDSAGPPPGTGPIHHTDNPAANGEVRDEHNAGVQHPGSTAVTART